MFFGQSMQHPDDEWDTIKGMEIAKQRADEKAKEYYSKPKRVTYSKVGE